MDRTMNVTLGLLVILAYFVARWLVKFAGKDEDRRPPVRDVPSRPDRSSDRDIIERID
jgi:hypothetical protein